MATTIQIGQTLGNYKVLRPLGEGGMGVVFEAVHVKLEQQRAALKTMNTKLRSEPMVIQRFRKEAEILSRLNHSAIVKIYDMGDLEDGSPYYIMEFVEGASLDGHIASAQRRPGGCLGIEFLPVIVGLASGLAHAHGKGIIHRDLKPGNIMIIADSMSPIGLGAKLLDFGIAKLTGDDQTRPGSQLGTPLYMAPEQIREPARVGGQADVYALGVILYEILSGQLPFENRESLAVMALKLGEAPRPLSLFRPGLPPELLRLSMAMLERDPAARPEMAEVEIELRLIAGMPLPRQTGSHNVPDSPEPTADIKPEEINALKVPPLTPGKINGELSPRPNPPAPADAPKSLSDIPSAPVQMAPYKLNTEDTTAERPPTPPMSVVERATSKEETRFDWRRLRPYYALGAMAVLIAAAGVYSLRLPHHAPAPTKIPSVEHSSPAPAAPPPAPATPLPAAAPLASPSGSKTPTLPEAVATPPSPKAVDSPNPKQPAHTPSAAAQLTAQAPTESCIITDMPKTQRSRLIQLIKSSGIKLLPSERLTFDGIPDYPSIATAPASLNTNSTPVLSLLGQLSETVQPAMPAHIEIRCRAK